MQSSLYAVSNSYSNFHLSWPSHNHRIPETPTSKAYNPKTPLKPLIISNSLKTSLNFPNDFHFEKGNLKDQEEEEEEDQLGISYRLPIVIRNSSSVLRYFWDGKGLKLVSLDGDSFSFCDFCTDFDDGFRKLVRICASALRNFLLPREVSPNYLEYVKWKFLHRVSSSALQVLATQTNLIGFIQCVVNVSCNWNWILSFTSFSCCSKLGIEGWARTAE